MPLTRYQIRNEYSLADPELYKAANRDDPEALLEGVAMAGLVGVLRQLGDLAEFAAEIFHNLHEEVMATSARGNGLMVRVQQLEAEVPSIEKAFLAQTNFTPFYSNAGVYWHPNLHTEQNLITRGDLPRCVMDSYEECRGPPRLFLLDKFDVSGAGTCLKRYTDPSFFKVVTAPSEPSIDAHRERKFRKVKKKGSRWKNGETPEIVPTSHTKLHQLFLEESVEKGRCDPARLVKLKKRQSNPSPFDSRSAKSFMEKFLETPPEHNVVQEISVSSWPLKLTSDNSGESGLQIYDIVTVSPVKETSQDKEIACSSPKAHEVIKPYVDELYGGEVIDRDIVKVLEPSAYGEKEEIPSIDHHVIDEKEIAVYGEGKLGGCDDGDNSDDLTSEVDNYLDALTTMESEMETDHESRLKSDIGLSIVEKCGTVPDRNWKQLEFEAHSSDSQSIENFSASDDGNSSFKKGRSSFSNSDTISNLAEIAPSDGEGSAIVFPTSEAFIPENSEMPSDLLPTNMEVLSTKSHDVMLPSDISIDENNISSLGEVTCNSLADSNYPLRPLDPATSSFQHQSDETPSESMNPSLALSYSEERETNLADSSTVFSDMPSQTSDSTPFAVSSENHSVDKLDGGDPHASSCFHLSNNSELAPEKNSSDDPPDEALHVYLAEESYPANALDIKIGSPGSNTSPKEDQVPYSVLSEAEGSYVEDHVDLVSDVVVALPETEVYSENSTSMGNASQDCDFKEQQLSGILHNVPQVDLASAEETSLNSWEANIADISGIAASERRGASTFQVDAVDLEAVSHELPSNYRDDVVAESDKAENIAVSFTATDNLPAESCADDDVFVICPPGGEDPHKDGLECNELVSPERLTGPEAENITTQTEIAPKGVSSALCKLISHDECNSEMIDGVQNSLADGTQNSLHGGDVTIPPAASGLSDLEPESKSFHHSHLLDGGQAAMSSFSVHLPDRETSSEQLLKLQADQLDMECMKPEASTNSSNQLYDQIQSSNHTDQEKLSNDDTESCQEDLSSEPSPSGYSQQTTRLEISNTEEKMDSSSSVFPSFGLLPEATQVNLEEMPPLPPLPPMQWRLGKILHASQVPQREFVDHSPESFLSFLPFRDHEKAQPAFPAKQSEIVQPASPFSSVTSVEVEKSVLVSEQEDNVMQPSLSSLQIAFMANDANGQTTSHGLERSQSLNPFLTLSALSDEKREHGFLTSEKEVVQSSSNPFLSLAAVEDTASKYDPVSSSEKLIHSLNQSKSRLPHASEDLEEEYGDPTNTSVQPPRTVEDAASKYDLVSSPEKQIHSLNQSSSESGLQHISENIEEEHANPSDLSILPPREIEDAACTHGSLSSLEKPIHSLNKSAPEPALLEASENSKEEHGHTSDTPMLQPEKVEEQPQRDLVEPAWPFNSFALLASSELGQLNGTSIVKLPRPRNPLIDAVAAHDKSKLRKVTERVHSQNEPKADERNSLLEQIRTKSFNLKPAVVSRTSVQGPKTNLRVAAILEKANAIRQATAGSDEDDDEDWSDS